MSLFVRHRQPGATFEPDAVARKRHRWRVGLAAFVFAVVIASFAGHGRAQAQQKDEARRADDDKRKEEAIRLEKEAAARKQAAARAAVAVRAVAAPQVWPDAQFEQWVFQQDRTADGARRKFESQLTLQMEDIDHACELTDAQRKKLQLMGRGDIKRFFDRYDKAKHRFNLLNNDVQRLQEVQQDVQPLRTIMQAGLFESNSLFSKALRHTLTEEQFADYDAAVQDRRAFRHRAQIELAVEMVDQSVPLRDAQRRDLVALLIKETKPSRVSGTYEFYLTMYRIGRLPEEKVKPLLSDMQWKVLERMVNQYKAVVPNLRQNGLLPDEDDDGAVPPRAIPDER